MRLVQKYLEALGDNQIVSPLDVNTAIADSAADLRARYNLRTPDAIQIATALAAGCEAFLTKDRTLRRVEALRVLVLDELALDQTTSGKRDRPIGAINEGAFMTGKSHITIGVITYATFWVQPLGGVNVPLLGDTHSILALPIALVLVLLGSLLPDLDHPDGRLANERIFGIPLLKPFAWLINRVFGHRGATHSLLALAGVVIIGELLFLPWVWSHLVGLFGVAGIPLRGDVPLLPWRGAHLGLLLGWGYAFHLLADGFTKSGVPLLWPLDTRFGIPPIRGLRFTTGTWREGLTVAVLTLACLVNAARAFIG